MSRQAHVASYTEVISDAVPDAIIPRILFDRVPTTFAGLPKQGKTYLATQLAICLATGQPFLGQATRQKRVLYCSWEVNIATLRDRMLQGCTDLGWPDPDPLFQTGAISFFAHTREGSAPMLRLGGADESDWETLSELRNEAEADVIILDTVSRVAHIEDKDSLAWSRFMSRQNKFCRQRGCSILSIDHTSRMRQEGPTAVSLAGAQSKATTAPVIVTLKDEGGDDPREQRWRLDISSWYGDQTGPIWYRRPLIADEFGGERPGAGCVVCEPPQQPCNKDTGARMPATSSRLFCDPNQSGAEKNSDGAGQRAGL